MGVNCIQCRVHSFFCTFSIQFEFMLHSNPSLDRLETGFLFRGTDKHTSTQEFYSSVVSSSEFEEREFVSRTRTEGHPK